MHTILETDCFVLKSAPSGEANKQLELFTRDFGMIRATAQGLRYLKSKLRYSLGDFSKAHVSLVRGKEMWRVTTAFKRADTMTDIPSREGREALFHIFALLRRLLQGEEPHAELFEIVETAFSVLAKGAHATAVEELAVLRILFLLGYVKDDESLRVFAEGNGFDEEMLGRATAARKTIVIEINRALAASHL